jgi:exosortase/archaeosortase family protein
MVKRINKIKIDKIYLIFLRYLVLLGLIFSLPLIYLIFTPLTLYPVVGLLSLIYGQVLVNQHVIAIAGKSFIELVPACIAGSAYLLLLMLNLSVPMKLKQRIYTILVSFAALLMLNILRIFILSILYHSGSAFFDITHKLFWYGLSTIFVVGIWFLIVKIFAIEPIPVYSDIKYFLKTIKKGK